MKLQPPSYGPGVLRSIGTRRFDRLARDGRRRFVVSSAAMPIHTVETRWFRAGRLPASLERWFADLGTELHSAESWETREDVYLLVPGSDEMGMKVRGGSELFEVKCRGATIGARRFGSDSVGVVEAWTKWSHSAGDDWIDVLTRRFPGIVRVWKSRLKRYFRMPPAAPALEVASGSELERGAIIEIARLRCGGRDHHSVAMEAFPTDDDLAEDMAAALTALLADVPIDLNAEDSMAYPEWMKGAVHQ